MTSACSKWVVPISVVNLKASGSQIASEVNGLTNALIVRQPNPAPTRANSIVSNGTISPGIRAFAHVVSSIESTISAARLAGACCSKISLSSAVS